MKKDKFRGGEINGFLDRTTSIKGELRFNDTMRIDGHFEGKIFSDNLLIVGETAVIDAEIEVAAISIMGRVRGTLLATARVEVLANASLIGDVRTPILRIDEGAVFEGRCDMGQSPAVEEKPARLAVVDIAARK